MIHTFVFQPDFEMSGLHLGPCTAAPLSKTILFRRTGNVREVASANEPLGPGNSSHGLPASGIGLWVVSRSRLKA